MVESLRISAQPHHTVVEAGYTEDPPGLRERAKRSFEAREGRQAVHSCRSFVVAAVEALKQYPMVERGVIDTDKGARSSSTTIPNNLGELR
jgi:hypothetical protein